MARKREGQDAAPVGAVTKRAARPQNGDGTLTLEQQVERLQKAKSRLKDGTLREQRDKLMSEVMYELVEQNTMAVRDPAKQRELRELYAELHEEIPGFEVNEVPSPGRPEPVYPDSAYNDWDGEEEDE